MTTATQCPTSTQLRAFSLGEMPEKQCDELFQHLQDCPICRAQLETFEDGDDSLIASLRDPGADSDFDREPDCHVAVAKAMGALVAASETSTPEILPKSIGEYELIRPLGHGGMGSVYLARHTKLGRQLALKVLASHRLADTRMKARFEAEMRAVGRLSHPNIVTAHDAREVDSTAVLVTEYIDGFDLGELVSRTGPLKIADACEIVCKVAAALQYISNQGFVHRDVKPSNIMVSTTGEVKLLDLGLARLQQSDVEITSAGQAMGTADFVAPEQVSDSRKVDARADIYSLGCTLFKLLTGHAPYATERHATAFAKMTAHVNEQPPLVSSFLPDAPDELVMFVDKLLSKDPNDRSQTPLAVADALSSFASQSDLKKLVQFSAQVSPQRATTSAVPTSRAVAQPWYLRPVPALVAIGAGMLGLLIGVAVMMIIITIRYKDGTTAQIKVPPGSHISIEDDQATGTRTAEPNGQDLKDSTATGNPDPKYSPLAFIVMVDANSISPEALKASQDELKKAGGTLLKTDAGYWYPLQGEDVSVPVEASVGGARYGLAEIHQSSRIAWPDIQGHVLSAQSGGGSNGIRMEFDDQLAKKLETLTGDYLNKQLGVVVDHKIVSAPYIRSKLSHSAVVSGRFTPEQTRFLMESIRGGLVREPKRPEDETARAKQRMQGVWVMDSGSHPDDKLRPSPVGLLVINKTNFLFVQSEAGPSAIGTIVVDTSGGETTVELRDVIGDEPIDDTIGVVRFPGEDEMHIGMRSKTDPDMAEAMMVFRNRKPFPQSKNQFLGEVLGHRFNGDRELVDQIYNALLLDSRSESEFEKLAEAIGGKRSSVEARNNLKMIALAFHNFHSAYNTLPGTSNEREGARRDGPNQEIRPFSWRVAILPFIGQQKLFEQYRFDEPWDSEANLKLLEQMPSVYRSPRASNNAQGYTVIQGFATEDGIMNGDGHAFRDITDGTSNTILVIESGLSVPWTKPQDLETTNHSFLKGKPILYALADGSVREDQEISVEDLKKLISRNGREVIKR